MTALETAPLVITEAGLVRDLPDEAYHGDPVAGGSLSHSGAKTIVNKTPALFAYEREHGRPNKRAFDFGHAAHQMILGVGPEIVAVDADSWRTNKAKDAAADAQLRGAVAILRDEMDTVTAMADAIRRHPVASKLLEPGSGEPEVSAFAPDPETGVWLRCRYDWLRPVAESGRLILVDYKTTISAADEDFAKSAVNFSYHLQDVFYSQIARLLGLAEDVVFLLIAQEKTPPYLVNVIQLDVIARQIGQILMRRAINIYADCTRTGNWFGYGDQVNLGSLPAWYQRRFEDVLS